MKSTMFKLLIIPFVLSLSTLYSCGSSNSGGSAAEESTTVGENDTAAVGGVGYNASFVSSGSSIVNSFTDFFDSAEVVGNGEKSMEESLLLLQEFLTDRSYLTLGKGREANFLDNPCLSSTLSTVGTAMSVGGLACTASCNSGETTLTIACTKSATETATCVNNSTSASTNYTYTNQAFSMSVSLTTTTGTSAFSFESSGVVSGGGLSSTNYTCTVTPKASWTSSSTPVQCDNVDVSCDVGGTTKTCTEVKTQAAAFTCS